MIEAILKIFLKSQKCPECRHKLPVVIFFKVLASCPSCFAKLEIQSSTRFLSWSSLVWFAFAECITLFYKPFLHLSDFEFFSFIFAFLSYFLIGLSRTGRVSVLRDNDIKITYKPIIAVIANCLLIGGATFLFGIWLMLSSGRVCNLCVVTVSFGIGVLVGLVISPFNIHEFYFKISPLELEGLINPFFRTQIDRKLILSIENKKTLLGFRVLQLNLHSGKVQRIYLFMIKNKADLTRLSIDYADLKVKISDKE